MNREQKRIAERKRYLFNYTINIHMFNKTKNTQKELMTTINLL